MTAVISSQIPSDCVLDCQMFDAAGDDLGGVRVDFKVNGFKTPMNLTMPYSYRLKWSGASIWIKLTQKQDHGHTYQYYFDMVNKVETAPIQEPLTKEEPRECINSSLLLACSNKGLARFHGYCARCWGKLKPEQRAVLDGNEPMITDVIRMTRLYPKSLILQIIEWPAIIGLIIWNLLK